MKDKAGNPVLDRKGKPKPLVLTLREVEIVRKDRPDPEKPNVIVRGGRRKNGLATMWKRNQLSDA